LKEENTMPYRIKARNQKGQTVTRMDLDHTHAAIRDRAYAQKLADEFASTRVHGGPWRGIVEHYSDSIANPDWDRSTGTVRNPFDGKK
jgi:hypothetical protein